MHTSNRFVRRNICVIATGILALLGAGSVGAWEPTKTVEFIVPAGTGGGADQMARFIQGIVAKN